ncbi:MAG TPA: LCP family protein [Euzebyales bacterium]|nr:LCP family protein [Euzebyales bacterium]
MTRGLHRVVCGIVVMAVLTAGAVAPEAVASGVNRTVIRPAYDSDGLLVVLVVGSDIGPPYRPGNPRRGLADAIHLVAVDPDQRRATVVDIPRDSVIGGTRVNAHLANGGPDKLVAELESFTDLTIDYWLLTTFRGFERLTEDLGGVDVVAERPMRDVSSHSNFDRGPAHVEGKRALAFARDRHSLPDGDFGRTRHQGDLLLAAHRRVVEDRRSLPELVGLVGSLARNTVSNIPTSELLPLAFLATDIAPAAVEQISLTGRLGYLGAASVVYVRPGRTFSRIRNGQVGPRETPPG